MKQLFTFLLLVIVTGINAQAPQSIPYQAVVRNTDGSVMADAAMTITFKIHDASATGNVVYEENHATTTNSQGLISLNVGNGDVVSGTFSGINWGSGNKFLHVLMNAGNGNTDLGTQQMLSVPYALYADKANTTNVSVSAVGDTLYLGNGNFILVPGISATNTPVTSGLGNSLLPGSQFCLNQEISVSGCEGQETLTYQGYNYELVEIAGQCWFKENLQADSFNNGTPITEEINNNLILWSNNNSNLPLYTYYENNPEYKTLYGNLYNGWCLESNNICPAGWHVPSECEWLYFFYKNGATLEEVSNNNFFNQTYGQNVFLSGKLLDSDTSNFTYPSQSFIPNNSSGFTAKLSGARESGNQSAGAGYVATFWGLNTQVVEGPSAFRVYITPTSSSVMMLAEQNSPHGVRIDTDGVMPGGNFKSFLTNGYSIRCIKD